MPSDAKFAMTLGQKIAIAVAVGAGTIIGAGAVYVITRVSEHTHLTEKIANLQVTIQDVQRELKSIETELALRSSNNVASAEGGNLESTLFRKKTVSFCSTTNTACSFRTAREYQSGNSSFYDEDSDDGRSQRTSHDTDYFSLDEDDDFFDVSSNGADDDIFMGPIDDSTTEDSELRNILVCIDGLSDGTSDDQVEALQMLKDLQMRYIKNAEVLWRLAKICHNMASDQGHMHSYEEKGRFISQAYEFASESLQLDPNHPEAHKWFAITSGTRGEYLGVRERIQSGVVFKRHIDRALQLRPNDSSLHHLLGRFCYEVSQLSWIERRIASALFGDVPQSSHREALSHFEAADALHGDNGGWKENCLYLARCHIALGSYNEALKCLDDASCADAPAANAAAELMEQEVESLRNKYQSYRS